MYILNTTFAKVYTDLLESIYNNPHYESAPRGLKIKECTNVHIQFEQPHSNLWQNIERNFPTQYLAGELIWYFSANNKIDFISNYSNFWKKIQNKDGTANSAYGYSLFADTNKHNITEWLWAYNSLVEDKDTRQAIMHFNKPKHMFNGNKDFPCTISGHFMIRDNKLHFTTYMRSQDLHKGMSFDIPFFTLLQEQMLIHLQGRYPNLQRGSYFHTVNSLHIYESDFEITEKMLETGITDANLPPMQKSLIRPDGNSIIQWDNLEQYNDELLSWIKIHSQIKSV